MSRSFRVVAVSLAVLLVSVAVLLVSVGNRVPLSDCEIAGFFHHPSEESSFEAFLEKRYRTFGLVQPGGWFTDPQYSFAIYYPKEENIKYKTYYYLISRDGTLHSRMAISMRKEEWESGNRVQCEEGAEIRART